MRSMPCVTMFTMTAHVYNVAATAASAIWMDPLILIGLIAVAVVILTGLAGRFVILCEDLCYTRIVGRNQ
jgi:hypothetical protein